MLSDMGCVLNFRGLIKYLFDFFSQVSSNILALGWVLIIRLKPHLNSELTWLSLCAFVQQTNSTKFIEFRKFACDSLEHQHFPDLLNFFYFCIEVKSEFTSILVDLVFPPRFNISLEKWKGINSLLLSLYEMCLYFVGGSIAEEVFNLAMSDVVPS